MRVSGAVRRVWSLGDWGEGWGALLGRGSFGAGLGCRCRPFWAGAVVLGLRDVGGRSVSRGRGRASPGAGGTSTGPQDLRFGLGRPARDVDSR